MTFAALQAETTQHVWEVAAGMADRHPGRSGNCISSAAPFLSEHARLASGGRHDDASANGESVRVHGGVDARSDPPTPRTGERTRKAPQDRARTRGTYGALERRSDAQHAGRIGGGERDGDHLEREPCGRAGLGIQTLGFRRYSEVLGEKSELTRLVGECLTKGSIFRREQVHARSSGRRIQALGVTISPIRRGTEKINGAICLLSGFDGAGSAAAADSVEREIGGSGRVVGGHCA